MATLAQIGYRLICKSCFRPFRCWREREDTCGCCKGKERGK